MYSESRYVMAQVEMPIEIKADNTIVSLHEYAKIRVNSLLSSKEDIVYPEPGPSIIEQVSALCNTETHVNIREQHVVDAAMVVVHKDDIKPRSRSRQNSTFKSSCRFKHRKTCKRCD